MFVSYLIDPLARSIEKVRDGFDRAALLIGTDRLDSTTLWTGSIDFDWATDPQEPDSSVVIVFADEAVLEEPLSRAVFYYRFRCKGNIKELMIAGKAVLVAAGEIPEEIAGQVRTPSGVEDAIDFETEAEVVPGAREAHWSWLRDPQTALSESCFIRLPLVLETDPDTDTDTAEAAATDAYAYAGARRIVAGAVSIRRYCAVTIAPIVLLGGDTARNSDR